MDCSSAQIPLLSFIYLPNCYQILITKRPPNPLDVGELNYYRHVILLSFFLIGISVCYATNNKLLTTTYFLPP